MAIVLALAAASLVALSLRLGLLATLLAGYVALVADIALTTWILSPFDGVTKWRLVLAQVVLFALASGAWWARGRPFVSLAAARAALRSLDAFTIAFLAV